MIGLSCAACGFAVLIIERGSGELASNDTDIAIAAGQTLVVPFAAGPVTLAGHLSCACLPAAGSGLGSQAGLILPLAISPQSWSAPGGVAEPS